MSQPAVTVVVISDYASGTEVAWNHLRQTLAALGRQDFAEPVDVVLVEAKALEGNIPSDLLQVVPGMRTLFTDAPNSYAMKNDAVRAANSDLVAILDGDCAPEPGWVRHMVGALRAHPNVGVVSGRTVYPRRTRVLRIMGLLERSYIERRVTSDTPHIANNAAGFRRSVYLDHPLPTDLGVFASQLQAEAIRRSGYRLLFEPKMEVTHEYDAWSFERDHRRGLGYGVVKIRQTDPTVRGASLIRLGYLSLPVFSLVRLLRGCWNSVRFHRRYNVAWYELPLAFVLAGVGCSLEIPGMVRALRGLGPPETGFR